MSLPTTSNNRELLHTRQILCKGYLREDGLLEIEGQLVDTKPFDYPNKDRGGLIKSGEALHDMSIRIALDEDLIIKEALAVMDGTPYNYCKSVSSVFSELIGVCLGPGWHRKIRKIMGGKKGCTHLTDLLTPIATTAIQSRVSLNAPFNQDDKEEPHAQFVPNLINTCLTHANNSPIVKEYWPNLYIEEEKK